MVLIERSDEAIAALAAETKRAPSSATAWSDLAAAQYAAALAGRTSLYPEALASVNRALRIDARMGAASFTRALILARLGLRAAARAAWQRYLAADAACRADEARGAWRDFDAMRRRRSRRSERLEKTRRRRRATARWWRGMPSAPAPSRKWNTSADGPRRCSVATPRARCDG